MYLEKRFDKLIEMTLPADHPLREDAEFVGTMKAVFMCGARAGADFIAYEVRQFTEVEVQRLLDKSRSEVKPEEHN